MDNINYFCRLCAESMPLNKLVDIRHKHVYKNDIIAKLTRLNCDTDFNDAFPTTICFCCLSSLNKAYEFVVMIEAARVTLSDLFSLEKVKEENIYSEPEMPIQQTNSESMLDVKEENGYQDDLIEIVDPELHRDEELSSVKLETSPGKPKRKRALRKKKNVKPLGLDVESIPLSQLSQMKLSWSNYNWLCSLCETQFGTIDELISHSVKVHNICNAYRCMDCKIRKLKLDCFLVHIRTHHKHLRTSCYKCFEPFNSHVAAREHKSKHLTTNFICSGCNTPFLTKDELQQHVDTYNQATKTRMLPKPLQTDNLTCKVCQKSFNQRGPFITHVLTHMDRKAEHICEVCGKGFHTRGNLAEHMTMHSEDRPYKCKICNQAFRTERVLKNHVSIHNKDKPFSCDECGRCFRLRNQLKSHSIVHTDLHPFGCKHCSKRFRFKSILNAHTLLHTGIKPYGCKICDRDFANWSNYNKHMKRKHNMDTSKKKHTPNGCVPIDPKTGELVLTEETQQIAEWKKQMLIRKRGRPPKVSTLGDKLG